MKAARHLRILYFAAKNFPDRHLRISSLRIKTFADRYICGHKTSGFTLADMTFAELTLENRHLRIYHLRNYICVPTFADIKIFKKLRKFLKN